jgi:hypothetical protein
VSRDWQSVAAAAASSGYEWRVSEHVHGGAGGGGDAPNCVKYAGVFADERGDVGAPSPARGGTQQELLNALVKRHALARVAVEHGIEVDRGRREERVERGREVEQRGAVGRRGGVCVASARIEDVREDVDAEWPVHVTRR